MKRGCPIIFLIRILFFIGAGALICAAQPGSSHSDIVIPPAVSTPPEIDGSLDDSAWKTPPLDKYFMSYQPIFGEKLPFATQVWIRYDRHNLFFAFRCYDSDVKKIKTSITKRDHIFTDDWVGLSIDTLGNRQIIYEFFVNPNGIQGDSTNSAVNGEDISPDFVWESAGKLFDKGYQVEIRIPLQSIRFKGSKQVKMGIIFRRQISRLGLRGAWPEIKPGDGIFNALAGIVYKGLERPMKFELLPSVTYSRNRQRRTMTTWHDPETLTELGIDLKYGLTSSVTLNLTVNPDFSQVESDMFQVEVNRRYPLFYSEKRPFFLESADDFAFFTIPDGYFPHAVHTRRIVDPRWGGKLSGSVGKLSFGILSAADDLGGTEAFHGIARARYSLGKDNYIGFLYSGCKVTDRYNQVVGADIGCRVFKHHKVSASFLHNVTDISDIGENGPASRSTFDLLSDYSTKHFEIMSAFEHVGGDFRMDSAFLLRRGINNAWVFTAYKFHPDPRRFSWLKMIKPWIAYDYLHDLSTGMDDNTLNVGIDIDFTKQGYLEFYHVSRSESWREKTFDLGLLVFGGGIQISRWLEVGGQFRWGDMIDYEADSPYKGKGNSGSLSLVMQPNRNLNLRFAFNHSELSHGENSVYNADIFYSRVTYQFNKYFFLRAVIQYDSVLKRILTDFLASFTLVPGTVLHLGYGGLYENRVWRDGQWQMGRGDLVNIKNSLFFKAGYRWRF